MEKVDQEKQLEEFFEALDLLAQKERDDSDFELMKKAVSSMWDHLPSEDDN